MRLILLLGVVTWHVTNSNTMAVVPSVEALNAVTHSINTFSSQLFKVIANNESGNLICSPISVSMVLSMAAFGARGNTETQLRSALALGSNDALTKTGIQSLVDSFANYKEVELRLANKIFLAKGFQPKAEFTGVTESAFRSKAQNVDFAEATEASNTINSWCEAQTNNRIKDLIKADDLSSNTALVLVSAVYFKGNWASKFDATLTEPRPFHVDGTTVKDVPTMYRYGSYRYGELSDLNAKFVEIPYKSKDSSDAVSMFIILPDEINGLVELEKNLDKITVEQLLRGTRRDVNLYLPKFTIESTFDLKEPLTKMGLTDMFTDTANFTGIVDDRPLKVSKVTQKAFIKVDEEGSEAAAATGLEIMPLSLIIELDQGPIDFKVNKPAHLIIITKSRQECVTLFAGSLRDPIIA